MTHLALLADFLSFHHLAQLPSVLRNCPLRCLRGIAARSLDITSNKHKDAKDMISNNDIDTKDMVPNNHKGTRTPFGLRHKNSVRAEVSKPFLSTSKATNKDNHHFK
jgi:hypothetical protein